MLPNLKTSLLFSLSLWWYEVPSKPGRKKGILIQTTWIFCCLVGLKGYKVIGARCSADFTDLLAPVIKSSYRPHYRIRCRPSKGTSLFILRVRVKRLVKKTNWTFFRTSSRQINWSYIKKLSSGEDIQDHQSRRLDFQPQIDLPDHPIQQSLGLWLSLHIKKFPVTKPTYLEFVFAARLKRDFFSTRVTSVYVYLLDS
jgi:hypothetical protein